MDGYPQLDELVTDGQDTYLVINARDGRYLYRYRPGVGMSRIATDGLGETAQLAIAAGPLGKLTPYLIVKRPVSVLNIHLLGPEGVSEAVATTVIRYGHPSIVGATARGLLINVPQSYEDSELYFTDGTPANSDFVGAAYNGQKLDRTSPVTITDQQVYFAAYSEEEGLELYRMEADGSQLSQLTDLHADGYRNRGISKMIPFRGGLIFRASGPDDNAEWWIVGPKDRRAKKIAELDDDGESSNIKLLGTGAQGELLFTLYHLRSPSGLLRTSGDRQTTQMVLEEVSTTFYETPVQFGDQVLFHGAIYRDGDRESGLLRTDGTTAGTYRLLEGDTRGTVVSGDRAFFAQDKKLYVTDGTVAGTRLVFTLTGRINTTTPTGLVALGDGILFEGLDEEQGYGVWFSDGTTEGTRLVKTFRYHDSYLAAFSSTGDTGYFMESHIFKNSIWRTDGTPEGTVRIKTFDGRADFGHYLRSTTFDGRCYFNAVTDADGRQIWVTDGTPEGTYQLPDVHPEGGTYYVSGYTALGPYLFYNVNHGLYRTDGTVEGTVRIHPEGVESTAVHDGLLYFSAAGEGAGEELFRTDGTVAGTQLVEDYNPGPGGSYPHDLTATATGLYFTAFHPRIGKELHHLVDCPPKSELEPSLVGGCSPVLSLEVSSNLGSRSLKILSSDVPVQVKEYADCLELTAPPGTQLTAELTVDGAPCGRMTQTFSATVPKWNGSACITTSIEEGTSDLSQSVQLYPNPTAGRVTIEVSPAYGGGLWQLYTADGQQITQGHFSGIRTEIETTGLASGLYFVAVGTAHERSVNRLIVR